MMKLLRDPFIHFLAIGGFVFLIQTFVWGPATAAKSQALTPEISVTAGDLGKEIFVPEAEITRRVAIWSNESGRLPTDQEIAALVQDYVQGEVLVREAVALGLSQGDTIIRRRLAQKMTGFLADNVPPQAPTDGTLRAWFDANQERFAFPASRTFRHVFLSPEERGQAIDVDADSFRRQLQAEALDWQSAGDPFILQRSYRGLTPVQATRLFGDAFSNALFELPSDEWAQPIESAFGLHIVYIDDAEQGRLPEFDEIEDEVLADYLDQKRRDANRQAIQDLINSYTVTIEGVTP